MAMPLLSDYLPHFLSFSIACFAAVGSLGFETGLSDSVHVVC
jgi:hypothetical protein